ncbi:DUF397 domain-containing protein [Streptomyces sp. NPDC048442]|uniref:DUF397 domain-containing protein n=1 Tax=Streptomyces sp. NPDC048442 TaxID=3154823 RepID=UPI00341FB010
MTQESAPRTTVDELEGAFWHKSSYSGTDNNCVEHGQLVTGRHAVRDTKCRERGVLLFDATTWQNFVDSMHSRTV